MTFLKSSEEKYILASYQNLGYVQISLLMLLLRLQPFHLAVASEEEENVEPLTPNMN